MERADIMSMLPCELREYVMSLGEPGYRAEQLFSWIARGMAIDEMTNLPKGFRLKLAESADYRMPSIREKYVSAIDGTVKYLMEMTDGECVETVLMRYRHGTSLCVSSQAGCAMGCRFCASTLNGRSRNLLPSEILGQAALAGRDSGERIDGIVMMGIGEPLDNFDASVRFIRLVSDPAGMGIGVRHISLSTCGIVPGIRDLAATGLPVTLSVSLHAADDATRSALMPINRKYGIAELLEACDGYFRETGRRVSFEYTLIRGKNDSAEDAAKLASVLKKHLRHTCHVNLIVLNRVDETGLSSPERKSAAGFAEVLKSHGINATVRRTLGSDINASCGQLRKRHADGKVLQNAT